MPGRAARGSIRAPLAISNVTRGGLRSARLLAAGTATRILLTPVVMGLILVGDDASDTFAAVLFLAAGATDYVDGLLARRWRVTTKLGSFLDTTADKLLVSGVLIALLAALTLSVLVREGPDVLVAASLLVLALFGFGIVGALRHPPEE